jgi:hypothetical protein
MFCSRMNVRFAPILLKKSISESSRFLREGLVCSLGNYVGDLVIGSLFNERPRVIAKQPILAERFRSTFRENSSLRRF